MLLELGSIDDPQTTLIETRIATDVIQKDLAEKIGVQEKPDQAELYSDQDLKNAEHL
jgi:hypothetical protein